MYKITKQSEVGAMVPQDTIINMTDSMLMELTAITDYDDDQSISPSQTAELFA